MSINWNEIKTRAVAFSAKWAGTSNEEADSKPFLVDFLDIFDVCTKRVGLFEYRVKMYDGREGKIDLLWKGNLLVEMKSRGKNLEHAYQQAKDYTTGLENKELPKYIMTCDFERFLLYDLDFQFTPQPPKGGEGVGSKSPSFTPQPPKGGEEAGSKSPLGDLGVKEFTLNDLVNNVHLFEHLIGYPKKEYKEQDPANVKAAELMGKLHDRLKAIGYEGHPLEVYLVRVLFIMFAEDTNIFHPQQFQDYILQRTNVDGSDLASKLQEVFQVLNTAPENRFKNIDEQLAKFPYINGKLFEEQLPIASFDSKMRNALLDCCYIDWSAISPAIFGSMFQSIMNPVERRNLGAHYTSEENILKLIKPLFLDELYKEFHKIKENKNKLTEFHKKLSALKFLDPACGCGNFLVITYRELRLLELEVLRAQYKNQIATNIESIICIDVDQFYGIEYEEFPARIAEVAMWLIDHQMNMLISHEFGQYFVRIPLKKSAKIVHGDALEMEWDSLLAGHNTIYVQADEAEIIVRESVVKYGKAKILVDNYKVVKKFSEEIPTVKFDYILGNPPFSGSKTMSQYQRNQVVKEFDNANGCGVLDYVTAWYVKAAKYINNCNKGACPLATKCAFVSTNSIVQGEQTAILWGIMLNKFNIKIHFAHRTFKWTNDGKGKAAVYCVIIGLANFDTNDKRIFDYEDIKGKPHEIENVKNINPYLVDAKDIFIEKRRTPICNAPSINFGNQPNDGGNLLFTNEEKIDFLAKEPKAEKFIKPFISAREFLNNEKRWCLWLVKAEPNEIIALPEVMKRIGLVQKHRFASPRPATIELAQKPSVFGYIKQPPSKYILIPRVSSENRNYIPMGFFSENEIIGDTCLSIPNANLYHFGVLMSKMHISWVKSVCGRLKSDFRYSNEIVYNNFPWAENPTEKQIQKIEEKAQQVLDVRLQFTNASLADLYNPLSMPPALTKAHNELDKAVDLAYRPQPFTNETNRLEFLFELYEKYTADLFTKEKRKRKKPTPFNP